MQIFGLKKGRFQAKSGENDPFESDIFKNEKLKPTTFKMAAIAQIAAIKPFKTLPNFLSLI